jgi:hypothetical protein
MRTCRGRNYERIVCNEKALDCIRAYIANNPPRWADDPENSERCVPKEGGFETRPYKPCTLPRKAPLPPAAGRRASSFKAESRDLDQRTRTSVATPGSDVSGA